MKNRISPSSRGKAWFLTALAAGTALLCGFNSQASNYAGNGNTGFGGPVGDGTLAVTDDGTNLTFTITPHGGNLGGNGLALYIDTGATGFSSTTNFLDNGNGGRIVLSGYDSAGEQSVMTFTNGFSPSYAISFVDTYTGLYGLVNGGANSLNYITGQGTTPYTVTFNAANIGLTPGVKSTIRIFGSFISQTGYRSTEAIAGNDTTAFGQGWDAFSQTAYATYIFDSPPIPTQPVSFTVDMTEMIATNAFNPANGDTVYVVGSFVTNSAGFQLTPSDGNPNIYGGTYPVGDAVGTQETFKFQFTSVSANSNVVEGVGINGRPFTLQSGGQVIPKVYFDDLFPYPSATTNELTFSIDMGPQIYLGHFNPANGDQICVAGTLESPYWEPGKLILTNNPSGSNPTVYSGTFADGNYPGSYENYKFAIIPGAGGNANFETFNGGANRAFFTPTNQYTFPLAYFNGVSNVYATPITFQVDMTAPLSTGTFNPVNGDTISVSGTFQTNQWTPGVFLLTNNPTAANSNIYSGTYVDENAPGTGEQYKFVITSSGTANYETIANRTFLLGSTAQTLPVVFYNNEDPNNVLLVPTTVTFTVNMTNAVDVFGNPFDPANDIVMVGGDFTNPQWALFNNATDPLISSDYSADVMTNNPVGSLLYSASFVIPAGNSLAVTYKYGIYHNTSAFNTNIDNEAGFGDNHERYIRATPAYDFPVDIFGIQRTNSAAATEPSFGNLATGTPVGGVLPLSWLGRPGVYLEYSTNLVTGPWVQINTSGGISATNLPTTGTAGYFRLVNP